VRIITIRRLREFWEKHEAAERALRAWLVRVEHADWRNFADLRRDFPSADQVRQLTVFDIHGNRYRLIARIEYQKQRVYVRAVLTHAEYDTEKWKDDDWYE
jgi:mRNA interferase HigB